MITQRPHPFWRVLGGMLTVVALGVSTLAVHRGALGLGTGAAVAVPVLAFSTSMIRGFGGALIDRRRRLLIRWWGLAPFFVIRLPLFFRRVPLDAFHAVERTSHCHVTEGETAYSTYTVTLTGDRPPVQLAEFYTRAPSRRLAETAARATGLPLIDDVDSDAVRDADSLDHTALDRLLNVGDPPAPPGPAPQGIRASVEPNGRTYEIPLPAGYDYWPHFLWSASSVVLAGGGIIAWKLLSGWPSSALSIAASIAVVATPAAYMLGLRRWGVQPERIVLDAETLAVRRCEWGIPITRRVPLAELEELNHSRFLYAVGDRHHVCFAAQASADVQAWLRRDILYSWWAGKYGDRPVYR